MPHTPSAKKSLRKTEKRRQHNRAVKKAIKVQIKTFLAALKDAPDTAAAEFKAVAKKLDKAAARRVIHPNLAARKKSQLVKKLQTKAQPAAK
jgi:small subunit ribosomal protein S20